MAGGQAGTGARRQVPSRRVTIADVASRAGVSNATVSRVMNGRGTVDAAIAERVREAATALDYRVNPLGRSLVLGRTETIGVVVPDLGNPTFQDLLRAMSRVMSGDGHRALVADSAESPAEEVILAEEVRRRCDGLVLVAPRMSAADLAALTASLDPVVVYNRPGEPGSGAAVDYAGGIHAVVEHLRELGHRHLVYLSGPPSSVSNRLRHRALEAELAAAPDLRLDVVAAGADFAAGHDAAPAVLATGATAAVAYNDLVAMGLLSGVQEAGHKVPDRLSVTGFDDIPFAAYTTPPLTTCRAPLDDAAAACWAALRAELDGQEPPDEVLLPAPLVVRASTGRAPS